MGLRVTWYRGVTRGALTTALGGSRMLVAPSLGKAPTFREKIVALVAAEQSGGLNSEVSVQEESWEQWKSIVLGAIENASVW